MNVEIVVFVAIFLGVLARAVMPYFRKALAGETLVFELKYVAIGIASFVTVWTVFPSYTPILDSWYTTITAAFTFGFGLQSVYTEIYAWVQTGYEKTKTTPQ